VGPITDLAPAANSSGISKKGRRIRPIAPGLAISEAQFAELTKLTKLTNN
jgi:hypothetical protein